MDMRKIGDRVKITVDYGNYPGTHEGTITAALVPRTANMGGFHPGGDARYTVNVRVKTGEGYCWGMRDIFVTENEIVTKPAGEPI
jgi:hypothetical protein